MTHDRELYYNVWFFLFDPPFPSETLFRVGRSLLRCPLEGVMFKDIALLAGCRQWHLWWVWSPVVRLWPISGLFYCLPENLFCFKHHRAQLPTCDLVEGGLVEREGGSRSEVQSCEGF